MAKYDDLNIACISDIHLGVHQDSALWHDQHIKLAEWIRDTLKSKNIKNIIIAGDIFHNRHEISVSTLHTAKRFFDILKDFEIDAITGNHDCYYRDNSKINSISVLESNNVRIFDTLVQKNIGGRSFAFCPWGTELSDIPNVDVVVGHFELLNFKMNTNMHCDHGWDGLSLLDKCHTVLTGHFHLRQERVYKDSKAVIYLGSPLELDWGDRDGQKGITIVNTKKLETTLIENTVSSKHVKVSVSELQNGTVALKTLKSSLNSNYVKIIVDVKFDGANVDALLTKFNSYQPLQLKVDYDVPSDITVVGELEETRLISIEDTLKEYIDLLEVQISKKHVFDKCVEYYKTFQTIN